MLVWFIQVVELHGGCWHVLSKLLHYRDMLAWFFQVVELHGHVGMVFSSFWITWGCWHVLSKLLNYMGDVGMVFSSCWITWGMLVCFVQIVTLQRHVGMFLPRVYLLLPCKEIQILANLSPKFNKKTLFFVKYSDNSISKWLITAHIQLPTLH